MLACDFTLTWDVRMTAEQLKCIALHDASFSPLSFGVVKVFGHVWVGNSLIITSLSYFHDAILHRQDS